ncbi:hypothetical protein EVAR_38372_1 [Eumeta japonica]|uniref:Uncharacterized protein n=1 Tax=Eumeta variegata TaxID=151549 RepID=A0A4C1XYX7_EUMVA|nr:hypothetical protein EVAR_38372_1 [Eumeta japonica]
MRQLRNPPASACGRVARWYRGGRVFGQPYNIWHLAIGVSVISLYQVGVAPMHSHAVPQSFTRNREPRLR